MGKEHSAEAAVDKDEGVFELIGFVEAGERIGRRLFFLRLKE